MTERQTMIVTAASDAQMNGEHDNSDVESQHDSICTAF